MIRRGRLGRMQSRRGERQETRGGTTAGEQQFIILQSCRLPYSIRNIDDQQAKARERMSRYGIFTIFIRHVQYCCRNRAKLLRQPVPEDDYTNDYDSDTNDITTTSNPIQDYNATFRPTLIPIPNAASNGWVQNPLVTGQCDTEGFATEPTSNYLSDGDASDDFVLRNARGRLVYIRRALLLLEEKWGAVARWPASFGREWVSVQASAAQQISSWLDSARIQVLAGRRIINDLARVMDGELPAVEEWRNLWLEAYQLLEMVYAGVLGLELSLDLAERQNSGIHLQAVLVI
jgi:hypothetical protein